MEAQDELLEQLSASSVAVPLQVTVHFLSSGAFLMALLNR